MQLEAKLVSGDFSIGDLDAMLRRTTDSASIKLIVAALEKAIERFRARSRRQREIAEDALAALKATEIRAKDLQKIIDRAAISSHGKHRHSTRLWTKRLATLFSSRRGISGITDFQI